MNRFFLTAVGMLLVGCMAVAGPATAVEASSSADDGLVPSFPGAEGFGRYAVGGRGGQVLHVTNLNDSGPGSLRWALEEVSGPRYVVFDVGGVINLTSGAIEIRNPYVTIAGQTAPGEGVVVRLARIVIRTHDVIMRGMRLRPDDEWSEEARGPGDQPRDRDALSAGTRSDYGAVYNIMIDHNSMSWSLDEVNTAIYGAHDISYTYNVFAEALDDSIHIDEGKTEPAPHGLGILFSDKADRITLAKNLMSTFRARFPLVENATNIEVINNFIYNWQSEATTTNRSFKTVNIINNYYKHGYESLKRPPIYIHIAPAGSKVYLSGNRDEVYRTSDAQEEYAIAHGAGNGPVDDSMRTDTPAFEGSGVHVLSVEEMIEHVLDNAGAIVPTRDAVDARIVDNARNSLPGEDGGPGRGRLVDKPEDVGGYYWYPTVFRPEDVDTDRDGMPNEWETAHGLDPEVYDANGRDLHPDYDNVEVYLNSLFE